MSDDRDVKVGSSGPTFPTFEMPQFLLPKFGLRTSELPAPFREMAAKATAQAKEAIEKMEQATAEASRLVESSCTEAASGAAEYHSKLVEAARANTKAAFDYSLALLSATSLNQVIELSGAHVQKQFTAMSEQTKELAALAQKAATAATERMTANMKKPFNEKS